MSILRDGICFDKSDVHSYYDFYFYCYQKRIILRYTCLCLRLQGSTLQSSIIILSELTTATFTSARSESSAMAPTCSISVRKYIQWLTEPPSEPTSTLVLTSAQSRFVDVRILNPSQQCDSEGVHQRKLINFDRRYCMLNYIDILPFSRLDWAFAGTSSTELKTVPDGRQLVHSKWRHWVDSRFPLAEEVNDEGDMLPQKDGTTLERGTMVNPATGQMTDYEECWSDVEPTSTNSDSERLCVVLQLHDDANNARGVVVRIGQYCQGLLRVGEQLALERWEWKKETGWNRVTRMGDMWLPCGVALDDSKLKIDGEVTYGQYLWKVVELAEF